jgi:FkbH-like protein
MNDRLLFSTASTVKDLSRQLKKAQSAESLARTQTNVSISLLANFSTQYMSSAIFTSLVMSGIKPDIFEASYDQWEFELNNPDSETNRRGSDFVVVALSSTRLILDPQNSSVALSERISASLIAYKHQSRRGELILVLPEILREGFDQTSHFCNFVRDMKLRLREKLEGEVHLVDIDPLIAEFGFERWDSKKFFISAKFCCHPNCYPLYGAYISGFLQCLIRAPVRLIIVDLDNTLWRGNVGDLGWEGIGLDKETGAYPYLLLQKYLVELKKSGVLLAVCSKNSPEIAEGVFANRPEMLLEMNDFVAREINWDPKSLNIRRILSGLNITTTGVAFLDDSRFEREEVRAVFPDLVIPELPESAEDWCVYLSKSGWFTQGKSALEAADNSGHYHAESWRNEDAKKYECYSDFLLNLDLILSPRRICEDNFDRVFELIHKTNQFNLTSRRLSRRELSDFVANQSNFCYCYGLKDRFGDYGIISVFIAEYTGSDWKIRIWLLSCRAMGRGVEHAVFDHFVSRTDNKNLVISGTYRPTNKNQVVSDLLERLGFERQTGETYNFTIGVHKNLRADHIKTIHPSSEVDQFDTFRKK